MDAFDVIVKEMNEKIDQLKDYLSTGRATTLDEYKAMCGEIKGLLYAQQYAKDLQRQIEESDD